MSKGIKISPQARTESDNPCVLLVWQAEERNRFDGSHER